MLTSARTGEGVNELFEKVAERCYEAKTNDKEAEGRKSFTINRETEAETDREEKKSSFFC